MIQIQTVQQSVQLNGTIAPRVVVQTVAANTIKMVSVGPCGPRGERGEKGDKGDTGVQGPRGDGSGPEDFDIALFSMATGLIRLQNIVVKTLPNFPQ
jgi:hypothetical protein